jgi:hypothetical protein
MRMVQEQKGVPGRMQAMGGTEHRILPRALAPSPPQRTGCISFKKNATLRSAVSNPVAFYFMRVLIEPTRAFSRGPLDAYTERSKCVCRPVRLATMIKVTQTVVVQNQRFYGAE